MPRTAITALDASAKTFPWSTAGLQLTETAADASNKNECTSAGAILLIAYNSGASSRTLIITSVADTRTGRTGDVSKTIAAGERWSFMMIKDGWEQSDNKFYFEASHAEVKFTLIKINP